MTARRPSHGFAWGFVASILMSGFALAQGGPGTSFEPSKDVRAKMAGLHEQMATCLRSDKSFQDCRTEMMTACQQVAGAPGCRRMGMGGPHRMMRASPPAATPSK